MKKVNDINLDEERGEESMERKIATTMKGQSRITTLGVPLVFIALFLLSYTCGLLTPGTAQATVAITDCAGCHGYTSAFTDGTARNNPVGTFVGSHNRHVVTYSKTCVVCHTVPATETSAAFNHANGLISVRSALNGLAGANYATSSGANYASAGNITVRNNPTLTYCYNTYCHSRGTSASNAASFAANNSPVWGANGTLGCNGCHGAGTTTGAPNYPNNATVKKNSHSAGGHQTACSTCHFATTSSGNTITGYSNHTNGSYNVVPNTAAANFNYVYSNNGGTCNNGTCHGSAQWGTTTFDCVTCHSTDQKINNGPLAGQPSGNRRSVALEFARAWSHKRAAGNVVTKFDCSVCHMEGDVATGGTNGTSHGNGYVELRDPDTGAVIQTVTAPAANSSAEYTSNAGTNARFSRFSRTIDNPTIEPLTAAIQINHCLKCHDSNGATSTAAQVSGGNALRPFGGAVNSTTAYFNDHIAAGNIAGSVTNVRASFNGNNASYHPVVARQNNWYAKNRMIGQAAWNSAARSTAAGNGTTGSYSYGLLMTCWDCHAPESAASNSTLTMTVNAHGGNNTLRGPVPGTAATSNTLCVKCHVTVYQTSLTNHGANSSWSTAGDSSRYTTGNCATCHGTALNTRPWKGQDAHGFNQWNSTRGDTVTPVRATRSGAAGAQTGHRPYNFIRSNNLAHVNPAQVPASDPAWTISGNKPGCVRASTFATGYSCGNGHAITGPGGVY